MCLKGIFETANDDGLINSNPAKKIKPTKTTDDTVTEKRAYTYEQARTVIEFAKGHPFGLDIICLLKTGMRRAELIAMPFKYENEQNGGIDMENRVFHIRQSLSESKYGVELGKCKTKQSLRDIPFDNELYEILTCEPDTVKFKTTDKTYPRKYLICGKYGDHMLPSNWSRRYNKFMDDLDAAHPSLPRLNPHELRHSFGSILYARGVDIVTISKLMGHSSIEITVKIYVHDDLEVMKDAINSGV